MGEGRTGLILVAPKRVWIDAERLCIIPKAFHEMLAPHPNLPPYSTVCSGVFTGGELRLTDGRPESSTRARFKHYWRKTNRRQAPQS